MNWISCKDHLPTEEKQYLITQVCFGHRMASIAYWSNNLYKTSRIDFYDMDNKSGFWDSDPEWGKYQVGNVVAWCEIEPYEGE